jgi:hypothetical protein
MAVGKAPLICRCGQMSMSALGFTHHRWQEEDRVSQSWHKRRLRVEPVLLEATASPRERGLAAMCTDSARNDPARNDRQPLVVLLSVPSGREPGRRVQNVLSRSFGPPHRRGSIGPHLLRGWAAGEGADGAAGGYGTRALLNGLKRDEETFLSRVCAVTGA